MKAACASTRSACLVGAEPTAYSRPVPGGVNVERLCVGDGSLVPRTLSVNPPPTMMALVSRAAEHLHDSHGDLS
jgi:hypothetical protein